MKEKENKQHHNNIYGLVFSTVQKTRVESHNPECKMKIYHKNSRAHLDAVQTE